MVEPNSNGFREAISILLGEYPRHLEFPLGGTLAIPMKAEERLLATMNDALPIAPADLTAVRAELERRDAYSLVTFATRMAVFAARTGGAGHIEAVSTALVLDDDLVDWRDMLTAFSIVEDCASRLGVDFAACISKAGSLAAPGRRKTIHEGYLTRSREMRDVSVMGFSPEGIGEQLDYIRLD